jgi:ParB-like chromosome segregation protein Spo0J
MQFHEVADLFPLLEGDDFKAFKLDVQENGQLETIKTLHGKILDGRNRWRVCQELNRTPLLEELPAGTDPVDYAVSRNIRRLHLTDMQRTFIAARLANIKSGEFHGNQYTTKGGGGQMAATILPISMTKAAKMLNVSERSIRRARLVIAKGVPEVQQAVLDGTMSLHGAVDRVVDLPKEKQREVVRQATSNKKKTTANGQAGKHPAAEKKEAPAEKNGEIKVLGVGVARANEAVDCLMRIPKNDALRKRGFQVVTDWIKRNR